MVVQDEQLFPAVLHDVLAEVVYEVGDGDGLAVLVVGGDGELVLPLVREEHLEAAPEKSQRRTFDNFPFSFLSARFVRYLATKCPFSRAWQEALMNEEA